MVYWVGSELLEVYKDYANNDEYFKTAAKVKWNQFSSYLEMGFTREEAMLILLKDAENMKKTINNVSSSVGKIKRKNKNYIQYIVVDFLIDHNI